MAQAGPQRGCVDCRLYAETGNPRSLCYVEQWSTLRDLQLQLRSPGFGMLLGIMETAPEAPALEVRTISEQRGLEYVRTIRWRRRSIRVWPTTKHLRQPVVRFSGHPVHA